MGTSGFAYKEWVGPFYPEGTKSAGMLPFYSGAFPSVEVNYTFRRTPSPSTLTNWAGATPDGFLFACKAHQGITHYARLAGVGERLGSFLGALAPLGDRLGPVLFQCPPNLAYDRAVLDDFLSTVGGRPVRCAMEFRHASFDTDEVRDRLAAAGVAWCMADTDEQEASFVRTSPGFAYVRLRRSGYEPAAMERWAGDIRTALEQGTDVFCYFKHEDSAAGPRAATTLRSLVEA